ncbi:hypothetical protein F5B22DRAFT_587799 [Xylaria bambusicola]|uniref:uncharacterized protein n=1 Tax=Xylaria bambusicola TaxID=326684 RepID=UPI00200855A9|nr:uncharacterized protein F5B22DRAFT_587799 [Xylaria bambusicola]KAI0525797.1 hypothetical protein F5B22DRAFT_587799 [Xylaria bambusicola]
MDSTTPAVPDTGEAANPPPVIFKSRGMRAKANLRKRAAPAAAPSTEKGSSDNSSDNSDSSSDERPSIAKRRRHGNRGVTSTSANKEATNTVSPAAFEADRKVPLTDTNDATKRSDWYDEPTKKGPVRSSTNVRMTITTDFAPDVCKDYKKTGWCGFGDACIFLHDRSDMKQGWQLDREWETVAKGRNDLGGTVVSSATQKSKDKGNGKVNKPGSGNQAQDDDDDEKMLEKIPFVCIICEKPYKSPIVTRCGHYFCEPCALKRYREDPSCKNCGAATGGVFNTATRLERLLKRKREAQIET